MKDQEFKTLFKIWGKSQNLPPLSEDHRALFLKQLKKKEKPQRIFKWAAILILCLGLAGSLEFFKPQVSEEVTKFQKAESYLTQIIEEQLKFYENQDQPVLKEVLKRSKSQLKQLKTDYQELYLKWEKYPHQPQLVNALIQNLNTQINLLSEINQTLHTLNQTYNENHSL